MKPASLPDDEQILGLAVFDRVGLPRDYFITLQHEDTEWIQLAFQLLGLQQLIVTTLELPRLSNAMIRTKVGNIVMVCYDQGYIAILLKRVLPQERPHVDKAWVAWICEFEANVVRNHPNFRAV